MCRLVAAAVLALLAACTHDLDVLRARAADATHDGGASGSTGASGSSGAGGTGGEPSSGGSGPPPQACMPCDALPAVADTLGFRSCCRGPLGRDCGITLGEAAVCLPRSAAGRVEPECPGAGNGDTSLDGCCRPDGRCGLQAPEVGCIAREDLPAVFAGARDPVFCAFECEADADCASTGQDLVCSDSRDRSQRACARLCDRDADCGRGEICGLLTDAAGGRVHAVCQPPIGDRQPADPCDVPASCVHGVCVRFAQDPEPSCSQLCADDGDCPEGRPHCVPSNFSDDGPSGVQDFHTCAVSL